VEVAGHGRRLGGAQSPELGKETVVRAIWVEGAGSGEPRDARERGECGGVVCMAGGGLTEAAVSGGAMAAVKRKQRRKKRQ
jgi:hypothetical protein